MELELGNDDELEEICYEDEVYNIDNVFEQETCGICIDIVIDRGVLDCCDHWFCFACIDNWATITNLCPICKNEFQLITCLPVYDTVRSISSEELPLSRNEDWSIQGKNNALSFPSYYISEDAVKCLENDGCKIRNALLETEEDLSFDTSIACDSCDIWYHAFCVGFNPEFTSENSWLCPRCINNQVLQNSGAISLQRLVKYSASQTAEIGQKIDPCLSGKVSVSIADAGETAVVVSMIAEKQKTVCERSLVDKLDSNTDIVIANSPLYSDNETSEPALQQKDGSCNPVKLEYISDTDKEHCTNASDIDNTSEIFFDLLPEIIDFKPYGDLKEATLSSFSCDASTIKPRNDITGLQSPPALPDVPSSLCYSCANDEGKNINALETKFNSLYSDGYIDTSSMALCTSKAKDEPNNKPCDIIDTYLASTSTISAGNLVISCNKDMVVDICQMNKEGCNLTSEPSMNEANMNKPNLNKAYTKSMNGNNDCIRKRVHEDVFPVKKPKLDKNSITLPTRNQSTFSSLDGSQMFSRKNRGASLRYAKEKEAEAADIMSIIQESGCTSHDMPTEIKAAKNFIDKKDSTCGLRVKKIMRRVGEKKESSILAQEIGKEIREVVQKKSLKDVGKNDFDEKLLAAFRAAMVRPQTELTSSSKHVLVGSKKHLSVKGKKRENLTKKIYGTSSGRRRHAWARDLEIEFWKHRCRRAQYEKVETLQSVLELLKKATNPNWDSYTERDSQEESTNSILSRVYIADASLFPRKDDIKPLSALSESSHFDDHNLDDEKSLRIVAKGSLNDNKDVKKNPIQLQANFCDSIGKNIHSAGFPGGTLYQKANSGKAAPDTIQGSSSSCSKESIATSKDHSCPSDAKSDKRKWALEVLARKTTSANMNANKGQENDTLLKGNYPLLAQLPQDMRPKLVSTRHNKVSSSIRQVQLYRITEHYLRRANLPFIRRTAETELAVADAINVEKEIFERSNSKLVYINLCSQAASQLANKRVSADANISNHQMASIEATESAKSDTETDIKPESTETNVASSTLPTLEICNKVSGEGNISSKDCGWSNVEEALKMAGLFSDSPPSSPYCVVKDSIEDECAQENVLQSLNFYAQDNAQHAMDTEQNALLAQNPGGVVYDCINVAVELPFDFSHSLEQQKESVTENCNEDVRMDNCLPTEVHEMGICNNPSSEECEGGDKEPLMNQISEKAIEVLNDLMVTGMEENLNSSLKKENKVSMIDTKSCISDTDIGSTLVEMSAGRENLETHSTENLQVSSVICDDIPDEDIAKSTNDKSDLTISISKKVEAYIKEHIRPLCKSGVITVEQYHWAVGKTLAKVMNFHHKAKNANFLIREGENVKKLAEQYVKASQKKI